MKILLSIILILVLSDACFAWEPYQEPATSIKTTYNMFKPFGETTVDVKVSRTGFISKLKIKTKKGTIDIPITELKAFESPSLPDMEIMSFGEKTEYGMGGAFSLCIPYGRLTQIKNSGYWQRAVLSITVFPDKHHVLDIPLPEEDGTTYGGHNGCESAGQEVYGL